MILIETGDEQVSKVHTSLHTLIHITCNKYCLANHIFAEGSVTTIVWPSSGFIALTGCEVHNNATIVVSGNYLRLGRRTILHKGANICGCLNSLNCFTSIPNELNVKVGYRLSIHVYEDGDLSENELDVICRNRNVEYYNRADTLAPRFIDRMLSNFKFYASPFGSSIYRYNTLRAISHSLLAMVSARDAKRIGRHSALRKLPRYMLMMCGEMLV